MALIVNGELVEDGRFIEMFRQMGGFAIDPAVLGTSQEAAMVRQLAERRTVGLVLLRQMAVSAGFAVSAEEVSARRARQWGTSSASVCGAAVQRQLADDLLVEKYCHWLSRHEPRPSRAEVEGYYLRHRAEFHLPERVKAAHIVCNIESPLEEAGARMRIEQAEAELERGTLFAKVAERYSDCGGKILLGWVTRGTMVPEFEDVVFALPNGGRSGIFRTVFGLHIATVFEQKPAEFEPLEELRPVLARRMLEERRQRVVEAATEGALRSASIEVVSEGRASA